MKAEDTVMSSEKIETIVAEVWRMSSYTDGDEHQAAAKAQAEISFKAGMKEGIWLFAWWKDGVQYVGTSGKTLEQAYKELGLS